MVRSLSSSLPPPAPAPILPSRSIESKPPPSVWDWKPPLELEVEGFQRAAGGGGGGGGGTEWDAMRCDAIDRWDFSIPKARKQMQSPSFGWLSVMG